ncbi:MAG: GNAT family N-acetyltransferase, partial [Bacillota bacterium]
MYIQEGKYLITLAETAQEREQVFKLRHKVYQQELNFSCKETAPEQEYDAYDELCDHLLIRDTETNLCVGTFRFLRGKKLQGKAGFYSEQWFDIGALKQRRNNVLELGRACIDAQYRNTKVFKMLFAGVGAYLKLYP